MKSMEEPLPYEKKNKNKINIKNSRSFKDSKISLRTSNRFELEAKK